MMFGENVIVKQDNLVLDAMKDTAYLERVYKIV